MIMIMKMVIMIMIIMIVIVMIVIITMTFFIMMMSYAGQVRCLRRWLREMEARIDPLQVVIFIIITNINFLVILLFNEWYSY